MNCRRAQNLLALHSGGDLDGLGVSELNAHLATCSSCRNLLEHLERNQALLRSLRPAPVPAAALADVRQKVFARASEQDTGILLMVERWLLRTLREPGFAVAGLALLGVMSLVLLAQTTGKNIEPIASLPLFEGQHTLRRPEGYREWIYVGAAVGSAHVDKGSARVPTIIRNVYINPAGYDGYLKSGVFPDGTMMVAESAAAASKHEPGFEGWYEEGFIGLQVSVKDSRFEGGWGYFDFTAEPGSLLAAAQPEGSACISCHRDRAGSDHVFTQFYPVLRAVARVL